ncbi:ribonuclease J [Spiroplasma endosymbiont of Clivina fossor]|uniref:ribonuclease J n=1 Tax=Spiroplasma endosymbiont of Clivina fossor TaxID=3066282 RepID=UPI00313EAAB6
MATIKVFALGGLDERGKNMYVVEVNHDIFIFDAGSKIPEREALGIDTVIPDFSYLKENVNRIKGLFISKPSEECFGAITYLLKDIKISIYASKLTIFLIKQKLYKFKVWHSENELIEIKEKDMLSFGDNEIEVFNTTTCIPGSFGFALKTVDGTIVYTGDYIFDSEERSNFATDMAHLAKIASNKILLLMSDSGYASRNDYTAPNHKCKKLVESTFKAAKSKIIIACHEQDLYKISEILELVSETNRDSIVMGGTLKSILEEFKSGTYLQFNKIKFRNLTSDAINDNSVIFVTGSGERLYTRLYKIISGDDEHLEIEKSDTVILATPPIPGYELKHARILDELARTDARFMALSDKKVWDMNASYEDIKMMIGIMKPKFFMPIKGLHKNFVSAQNSAQEAGILINNILIKDSGQILEFINGKLGPSPVSLKCNNIYVDGLGVGDIGAVVLNERKQLARDGVLISGITLNRRSKEIVSLVDVQMRGVVFIQDDEELTNKMQAKVRTIVEEHQKKSEFDGTTVKNQIRSELQELCRQETGKNPMVLAIINEIN